MSLKVHNNCFYTIDWTGSNNIEANSSHFLLQFAQNNSEISVSSDCGEKFCKALCETLGDDGGGYWLVRMEWCPAGWSVCLPLLIFPCTMKSRSSLLAPAHPGGPGKRAIKRLCVCDYIYDQKSYISLTEGMAMLPYRQAWHDIYLIYFGQKYQIFCNF